ncbi:hypothetical protein [Streptomyces sp. 1222.2]|uniref:hypothetical protein n=1 Tax=Streptomyces sp. 1222.2 TaxID=1938833 RepID=UPI00359C1D1D
MVSVFAEFIFNAEPMIKQPGFALAAGVLVDPFVIRMTLIPGHRGTRAGEGLVDPRLAGPPASRPRCRGRQARAEDPVAPPGDRPVARHGAEGRNPSTDRSRGLFSHILEVTCAGRGRDGRVRLSTSGRNGHTRRCSAGAARSVRTRRRGRCSDRLCGMEARTSTARP